MLVSVYIRKEDEELWKNLEGKAQAIHEMLHNKQPSENFVAPRVEAKPQPINDIWCEHGFLPDRCKKC